MDPRRSLTQAQGDRLSTYVGDGQANSPWWYYVGLAVASGAAVSAGDVDTWWIAVTLALTAVVFIGALIGALTRRTGIVPRLRGMPAPLLRVLVTYWTVAGVIIGAALLWAFTTDGDWVFARAGAVVTAVSGVGGVISDRIYRRRARTLAEEAGVGHE